jgi:hypothetical protein
MSRLGCFASNCERSSLASHPTAIESSEFIFELSSPTHFPSDTSQTLPLVLSKSKSTAEISSIFVFAQKHFKLIEAKRFSFFAFASATAAWKSFPQNTFGWKSRKYLKCH